jgi:hypothetical protein
MRDSQRHLERGAPTQQITPSTKKILARCFVGLLHPGLLLPENNQSKGKDCSRMMLFPLPVIVFKSPA